MKIKFEFKILLFKNKNLSLFRIPLDLTKFKQNLKISQKKLSKAIEIDTKIPKSNFSLYKEKLLDFDTVSYYSLPFLIKNYFYTKINKESLYINEINSFYILRPKLKYKIETKSVSIKKAETREEFEHRKNNINYKLKLIDQEDLINMNYIKNSDFHIFDINNQKDCFIKKDDENIDQNEINSKLKKIIFNNVILNKEDISHLNIDKKNLSKLTFKLKNKFILKNDFYEKSLHKDRNKVIELFLDKEEVNFEEFNFIKEKWILEEIAILKYENKRSFYKLR